MTITLTGNLVKQGNARRYEIRVGGKTCLLTNRSFRFLVQFIFFSHSYSLVEWEKFRVPYGEFNNTLAQLRRHLRQAKIEQEVINSFAHKSGLYELCCGLSEVKMNVDKLLETLDEDLKVQLRKLMERKILK